MPTDKKTMWLPNVSDRAGPKYLRIADAMAEDIYSGRLAVGERLPTHRDLAWRLGVTVGTVSRAYAEAERRGLVVGEVGRGSFVRAGSRSAVTLAMPNLAPAQTIELGINRPPVHLVTPEFSAALAELAEAEDLDDLANYQAHTGRWEHRVAGSAWLARRGLDIPADRVLLTSGAEHAITAAFMAFTDPGDSLMVEQYTWSGTRALAGLLRLTLRPVAIDEYGILPEAFEATCKTTGARMLYITPTVHNPTTATLPDDRRREIARIASIYGVTIIEDDLYGFLEESPPPPLATYAPERSIYITGASKCVAPSLRVGFAAMPEDRIGRFSAAARATNWMAPPLMAEIFARWIGNGTADRLAERIRREAAERQRLAASHLRGRRYQASTASLHAWLHLPEPWRASDLVEAAKARGVSLAPTDLFVPGRCETPHAVRLSLTATATQNELERGLGVVADILQAPPEPFLAVA